MSVYGKLYYGNNESGEHTAEPPQSRFLLFFHIVSSEWRNLVKLNFLFLMCCLPIVTIGAAASAMSYILKKLDEREYVFLTSDFFRSFKENFKVSSLYFLFYGGGLGAIVFLIKYMDPFISGMPVLAIPIGIAMIAGVIMVFAGFYGFCMIGTMDLSWKNMFCNSLLLAFLGLKANAVILLFTVPLALLCYWLFPYSVLFLIPFGASFKGLIIIHNIFPVMKKTIIK